MDFIGILAEIDAATEKDIADLDERIATLESAASEAQVRAAGLRALRRLVCWSRGAERSAEWGGPKEAPKGRSEEPAQADKSRIDIVPRKPTCPDAATREMPVWKHRLRVAGALLARGPMTEAEVVFHCNVPATGALRSSKVLFCPWFERRDGKWALSTHGRNCMEIVNEAPADGSRPGEGEKGE